MKVKNREGLTLSKIMDIVTNPLKRKDLPTEYDDVTNKQYVDTSINNIQMYKVGQMVLSPLPISLEGFLICNGGILSKTEYTELYSYLGDTFTPVNTTPGSGRYWDQQYSINNIVDEVYTWATGSNISSVTQQHQVCVTNSTAYVLGGATTSSFLFGLISSSSYKSNIYKSTINTDGTLGSWSNAGDLPKSIGLSSLIIAKSKCYLIGGMVSNQSSNNVHQATIDNNGVISSWYQIANFPIDINTHRAIITKKKILVIGGLSGGSNTNRIYYSAMDDYGNLGTWTRTVDLPEAISCHSVAIIKNKLYVIGGMISSNNWSKKVYSTELDHDGLPTIWVQGSNLSYTCGYSSIAVFNKIVMLVGGYINSSYSNKVLYAKINDDGTLQSWIESANTIPDNCSNSGLIATSNRLYLVGGYNGSATIKKVYQMNISGSMNDYSDYYKSIIDTIDTPLTHFRLPDYSYLVPSSLYFYIKY